jgi:hypothetical protein
MCLLVGLTIYLGIICNTTRAEQHGLLHTHLKMQKIV